MNNVRDVLEAHDMALSDAGLTQALREAVRFCEGSGTYIDTRSATLDNLAHGLADGAFQSRFVATLEHVLASMTVPGDGSDELTEAEVGLLENGFDTSFVDPRARAALEQAAMVATSVSVAEVASRTNWNVAQVHKQIDHGGLLAFPGEDGYQVPVFQFAGDGGLVPHLGEVLPELIPNIHPLGLLHWFTEPNPDLVCEETVYDPVSPREWLMRGLPPEPVRELARYAINES